MRPLIVLLLAALALAACDSGDPGTPNTVVTATDDTARVAPSQTVVVNVLSNDTASSDLDVAAVGTPSCGSVTGFVAESGAVTFRAPGTVGTCTFTYTATDGSTTDTATVTVTVQGTIVLPRP